MNRHRFSTSLEPCQPNAFKSPWFSSQHETKHAWQPEFYESSCSRYARVPFATAVKTNFTKLTVSGQILKFFNSLLSILRCLHKSTLKNGKPSPHHQQAFNNIKSRKKEGHHVKKSKPWTFFLEREVHPMMNPHKKVLSTNGNIKVLQSELSARGSKKRTAL